jgi:glycerophosphoryl diester phosphodiesterase
VILDPKCDDAVEPLVDAIRAAGALDRVCVGSFSHRRLAAVRAALGPGVATSMSPTELRRLRFAAWGLLPRAAAAGPAACVQIPPDHRRVPLAEPRLIELAHALGLPVHVWTVNREHDMRRLLDLGVDGIITDDVETLRTVMRERGTWR